MRIYGWKNGDPSQGWEIPDGDEVPEERTLLIGHDHRGRVVYEFGDEDLVPEEQRPRILALVNADCPDDLVLWRYIDIPKLYMLLVHGELHFTPAARLRQDEGYEFRIPLANRAAQRASYQEFLEQAFPGASSNARDLQLFDAADSAALDTCAISCWHINSRENNAFWSGYVPHGGVAIKTTLGRVKNAYAAKWRENLRGHRWVCGAKVEYINYETDTLRAIPSSVGMEDIFHKADFFAFEQEFRFALLMKGATPEALRSSCRVPIDVGALVEEIVIGPRPKHMTDFIVRDMARQAGLNPSLVRPSRVGPDVVASLYPPG